MKRTRKYLNVILLFMLLGCNFNQNEKFILNSIGKEWKLDRVNDKRLNSKATFYLTFYQNGTYDLYYKKENGEKYKYSTDIPVEPKWFFDKNNNLHIANFDRMGMDMIRLDNQRLVFKSIVDISEGLPIKFKWSFICNDCK